MAVLRRWIEVDDTYFDNKPPGRPRDRTIDVEWVFLVRRCKEISSSGSKPCVIRKRGVHTIRAPTVRECKAELALFIDHEDVVLVGRGERGLDRGRR